MQKIETEKAYELREQGYTFQEIGDRFGISRQAVQSSLQHYEKRYYKRSSFKCIRNERFYVWATENLSSLQELADKLQISMNSLYKYLRGDCKTIKIPLKLQEITGLPLDDLITKRGEYKWK